MSGPDAISATALSKQVAVPQATLSKWLRKAGVDSSYVYPNIPYGNMTMAKTTIPKPPKNWSAKDKLAVVLQAASVSDDQLGAFLRSKGLHETHLEQWHTQILGGLKNGFNKPAAKRSRDDINRIRELEKELRRKDKALAETAALLVLKKKVQQIWGDEDEDTAPSKGR